jgi:hypothetical protein
MQFAGLLAMLAALGTVVLPATGRLADAGEPFHFVDATAPWGLAEPLRGIKAHAMACGDVDGDDDLDIYIGTFCDSDPSEYLGRSGPVPNMLLIQEDDKYVLAAHPRPIIDRRTSGAVLADLDNDGDLDLYVSLNSKRAASTQGKNRLYENIGGRFRDVSAGNAASLVMGGRSIGVFDYDGDSLLDLLVLEDYWQGGHTRLFRNRGNLKFEDVTEAADLRKEIAPGRGLPGLGIVTPDFNRDGRPDLFISQPNLIFLSTGDGGFRQVDSTVFESPLNVRGGEFVCGVACRDLDNDADLDIVTVDHRAGSRVYLYVNEGLRAGQPRFREVTRDAGLDIEFPSNTPSGLYLRQDHVEIADFDNDGRPDILLAATYVDQGRRRPFICRNLGGRDGAIRFAAPPAAKVDAHYPAGPVADYDRDGRMDVFMASWFPQIPSALLLNRTTPDRHWLQVKVQGKTVNRMGIGSKIAIYEARMLGQRSALLGHQEINVSQGYCSGHEAVAHFGLGNTPRCDVEVVLPFGKGRIVRRNVAADQLLLLEQE